MNYKNGRLYMFFTNLCLLVLWMKVASAFEGLIALPSLCLDLTHQCLERPIKSIRCTGGYYQYLARSQLPISHGKSIILCKICYAGTSLQGIIVSAAHGQLAI